MDELMVTRRIGEFVDHRLIDEHPIGGAEMLPDFRLQFLRRDGGHMSSPQSWFGARSRPLLPHRTRAKPRRRVAVASALGGLRRLHRSEEHTSELKSLMRSSYAVF